MSDWMKSKRPWEYIHREFVTHSPEITEEVGETLAQYLHPGDVVGLYGELGAGKTCLVRGIAKGLKCPAPVTSPTFTLINEYPGPRLTVYHFDLYRLNNLQELEDLGLLDYLYGEGVCVLEWAEKAVELLPPQHWKVHFKIVDAQSRRIQVAQPDYRKDAA